MKDSGCRLSCGGCPWKWPEALRCRPKNNKKKRKHTEKNEVTLLTFDEALAELNGHKKAFKKDLRKQIVDYVKKQSKTTCTAIVGSDRSGRRVEYKVFRSGWGKRFWAMLGNKSLDESGNPALPKRKGEQLDSVLSEPIAKIVYKVHSDFYRQHQDVFLRHVDVQRVVTRHMASAISAGMKPAMDQACEALVHEMQQQLLGQVVQEVGDHASNTFVDVVTNVTVAAAASVLASVFKGALAKIILKVCASSGAGYGITLASKLIAQSVATSVATTATTQVAAHGTTAAIASPLLLILIPIVLCWIGWTIHRFPKKLGKKIAKNVQKILDGEFETTNRSVLEEVVRELLKDGGKEIGKMLVDYDFKEAMKLVTERVDGGEKGGFQTQTNAVPT